MAKMEMRGRRDGLSLYQRVFRSRWSRQVFPPACLAAFIIGFVVAPRIAGSGSALAVVAGGVLIGGVLSGLIAGAIKVNEVHTRRRRSRRP
jgi:hypothetical protein